MISPTSGHRTGRQSWTPDALRDLVAALPTHADTPEARQCIHYIAGNRHRGPVRVSGVVEAGCKQIGARLKRAILALRCCILNGRFEDSWERRAANAA